MRYICLLIVSVLYLQHVAAEPCSDGSSCPSSATCCQMPDGSYGCCPVRNAVCCDDHLHCCPEGTSCSGDMCVRGPFRLPMRRKQPSHSERFETNDVVCPGQKSKCPSGTTCCELSTGTYGCCPMPNAVCCQDRLHCCPDGYRCDTSGGRCLHKETLEDQPWLAKFRASPLRSKAGTDLLEPIDDEVLVSYMENIDDDIDSEESVEDEEERVDREVEQNLHVRDIACGSMTKCQGKSTCCQVENVLGKIDHMCCPLSQAVCCDGFCCPRGYTCTAKGRRCEKKAHQPPFYLNN